jgi:hypothetical protein
MDLKDHSCLVGSCSRIFRILAVLLHIPAPPIDYNERSGIWIDISYLDLLHLVMSPSPLSLVSATDCDVPVLAQSEEHRVFDDPIGDTLGPVLRTRRGGRGQY